MKKTSILLLCMLMYCMSVTSQTFVEMRKIYPVSVNDGQRVITGFQTFSNSDDQIFANAMKWSIETFCTEKRNNLFDIEVNKKNISFEMPLELIERGKVKYQFLCKTNIRVSEGKLVYTIYDIRYRTNAIVSLSYTNYLDKLNPEKKTKHKEIINIFEELASKRINQMFDAITENKCAKITHWNDIHIQRAVKGMNEDECYLAFGKPANNYEDNYNRVQWSYGLNFVLIFKEGILETIIR